MLSYVYLFDSSGVVLVPLAQEYDDVTILHYLFRTGGFIEHKFQLINEGFCSFSISQWSLMVTIPMVV